MSYSCKSDTFSKRFAVLAFSPKFSDVTFVVGGEKIPAHRVILAVSSEYFRAMLFGSLAESNQIEIALDVPAKIFKLILQFIYTGTLKTSNLRGANALGIFQLAHLYGLVELESAISVQLEKKLSAETAVWIRHIAELYGQAALLAVCDRFIDENAEKILLNVECFNELPEEALKDILQRDSLQANETQIFMAVESWCKEHPQANIAEVMSKVRLPLIDEYFLQNTVRHSGLVDENLILAAIQEKRSIKRLPCRVVSTTMQAEFVGQYNCYDLKKVHSVNCIKFKLNGMHCYILKVSKNQWNWVKVVDYSKNSCSSYQYLHFNTRKIRYIRFEGIPIRDVRNSPIMELQVVHTTRLVRMHNDVISPIHNVVCVNMGASILRRDPNNHYTEDEQNTNFNIGKDLVIRTFRGFAIRFGQPYYISSIRLHWSEPPSQVTIHTTADVVWDLVVDLPNGLSSNSWHHFAITPRVVQYISIKCESPPLSGFQCQVQCPSQDPAYLELQKAELVQCDPL